MVIVSTLCSVKGFVLPTTVYALVPLACTNLCNTQIHAQRQLQHTHTCAMHRCMHEDSLNINKHLCNTQIHAQRQLQHTHTYAIRRYMHEDSFNIHTHLCNAQMHARRQLQHKQTLVRHTLLTRGGNFRSLSHRHACMQHTHTKNTQNTRVTLWMRHSIDASLYTCVTPYMRHSIDAWRQLPGGLHGELPPEPPGHIGGCWL
jgi:hypothetical protein